MDHIELAARSEPLTLVWPAPHSPVSLLRFERPEEWRAFVGCLGIHPDVPEIIQRKFARAQKLYLAGWIDFDFLKAGELAALVALELAVKDRYGQAFTAKTRTFANLLRHMVEVDQLGDENLPVIVRCGGTAVGFLTGAARPTLAERRNGMAHGDPFEGLPVGGLLELVRDLINYAYRDFISSRRTGDQGASASAC